MTNLTSRFDNSYCFTTFKKNESSIDIFCFMISVKVLRTLTFGMISKIKFKKYLVFLRTFNCYPGGRKLFVSRH